MGKPKIRFKGYTDEWEQRKVSELENETYGGGTPKTSIEEYWNGNIPWIQSSDIIEHDVNSINPKKFISEEAVNKSATKLVPENSIAIVTRVGVGKLVIMPFSYATSQDFLSLSKLNSDTPFTAYLLYKKMQNESHAVQGTSIKGITKEELLSKEVMIPQLKEQKIIGTYFQSLDHLITLHQRKYEQAKTLKKYMLQKMFPQDGMRVPEIRFAGFTDEWEQRKLGEVIEDYVEKTTVENQYPVLTSSQQMGIVLQDDYFSGDRVSQSGNIGYFVIPRGYFAYRSRSDNEVFVFNRNDCIDKGSISYFYPVFKPSGVDSDFLLRRLNYGLETQLKIASEGTGQHVLSLKKFKNMTALFPSINEQRKIGEYFTRLDHLITLHQRKCDELRKIKKYMLQNMFC